MVTVLLSSSEWPSICPEMFVCLTQARVVIFTQTVFLLIADVVSTHGGTRELPMFEKPQEARKYPTPDANALQSVGINAFCRTLEVKHRSHSCLLRSHVPNPAFMNHSVPGPPFFLLFSFSFCLAGL